MSQDVTLIQPIRNVSSITRFLQSKRRLYPWVVWALGASFFFTEYIARVSTGVMVSDLMRDFHVGGYALGGLSAFFYYAYVYMQLPVGVFVDRFKMQWLLASMALLTGIGCALFASATTVGMAELGRFCMGFGAAFAFVSTLKLVAIWFPASKVGLLSGLTQALGMWGAFMGEAPTSILVDAVGWRYTMWVMTAMFVVLAFLIALIVRDRPSSNEDDAENFLHTQQSSRQATYKTQTSLSNHVVGMGRQLKRVLVNSQTWFNAIYAGLLYAPTAAFAELWGTSFFENTYAFPKHVAAAAVGMIFVGWGIGGPIMGFFSDYIGRRRPMLLSSAIASLVIVSLIIFGPRWSTFTLFLLLFLYGVANTGVVIAYAVATEVNPRSMAGTSLGFTNMASVFVGACLQPTIGWLLDLQADGRVVTDIMEYTSTSFRLAMSILPLTLCLCVVFAFFIKETHCRPVVQEKTI